MGGALWKAFAFGAVVAGSIGPIALLIFGIAARQGFAAGAFASLGAALADLVYALVAFWTGALILPLLTAHETAIRVGAALLLIGLGLSMLLNQRRSSDEPIAPQPAAGSLLPVFLLTIVNPMTVVVFAGIVPQLPLAGSPANAAWFAFSLCAGSILVQFLIAGFGAALGSALPGPGPSRAINVAAAAGILAFGIYGLAAES